MAKKTVTNDPVSEVLEAIWASITKIYHKPNTGFSPVHRWVIGSYTAVCNLRDQLRRETRRRAISGAVPREDVQSISEFVSKYNPVFGGRKTDVFPETRPKSRNLIANITGPDGELLKPDKKDRRFVKAYAAANNFYDNKTLEVHHIVEDNIIQKIVEAMINKELDEESSRRLHSQAPAVLVSAELHQRYFSKRLEDFRKQDSFTKKQLRDTYNKLYILPKMGDLKKIANDIIKKLPAK
jgi:hypothetical protein